jgi:hypothetical protein
MRSWFLSPLLLKECADILSGSVTLLFNQCLSTGRIADCWRLARITPVPKKGTSRFRPIACTSVLLKLFERVLLNPAISNRMPVDSHQFAYRQSRSTLDAIAYLTHSVAFSLNTTAKPVRLLFLDYTNAFGSIDREMLLQILAEHGVEKGLLSLILDYFTKRSQYTSLGGQNLSPLFTYTAFPVSYTHLTLPTM